MKENGRQSSMKVKAPDHPAANGYGWVTVQIRGTAGDYSVRLCDVGEPVLGRLKRRVEYDGGAAVKFWTVLDARGEPTSARFLSIRDAVMEMLGVGKRRPPMCLHCGKRRNQDGSRFCSAAHAAAWAELQTAGWKWVPADERWEAPPPVLVQNN